MNPVHTQHTIRTALFSLVATLTLVSGCVQHKPASHPTADRPPIALDNEQDGPPKVVKDIHSIPNAIPQYEPRARYGNHSPYRVLGKTYHVLPSADGYREEGIGSWYGEKFAGRKTSSFEPYDPYAMTAAHKSLPLPTYVRVKNLENNREVIVKVNDRGPFHDDRIIDLSYAAAAKLGYMKKGTARVVVEVIDTPNPAAQPPTPALSTPATTTATITPPIKAPIEAAVTAPIAPSITTPTTIPHSAPTQTTPPQIYLQVAAFSQLHTAQALEQRLSPTLKVPVTINSAGDNQTQMHRVRVGPFPDEMSAILVSEQIKFQNMGDPLIIHR